MRGQNTSPGKVCGNRGSCTKQWTGNTGSCTRQWIHFMCFRSPVTFNKSCSMDAAHSLANISPKRPPVFTKEGHGANAHGRGRARVAPRVCPSGNRVELIPSPQSHQASSPGEHGLKSTLLSHKRNLSAMLWKSLSPGHMASPSLVV